MAELNIAIADDNRQTLELLGEILEGEKDYHIVGKADNGNEAYNMILKTRCRINGYCHAGNGRNICHGENQEQYGDEGQHILYHCNSRRQ